MSDLHMVVFFFEATVVANMCCHEKCTLYHIQTSQISYDNIH
jgi:hypothetical protein